MKCIDEEQLTHVAPIIGYHRAPLSQKFGAPRQPNLVALISVIEMLIPYDNPAAFAGLEAFSHIWLSWQFHHNYLNKKSAHNSEQDQQTKAAPAADKPAFRPQVRPPRLGGNKKLGVFASRSMYRPSGLGLSVVKLEAIEVLEGRVLLLISGADMIDGTPIIDIKPYVSYSDAYSDAASGFAPSAPESLIVTMSELAEQQFEALINIKPIDSEDKKVAELTAGTAKVAKATVAAKIYSLQQQLVVADKVLIIALIAQDPRPAYRREELNCSFVMRYKAVDISFTQIELGTLQINSVIKV
ncbi:tRNA (N6-threonylcarbamoyladenosine(37)-N6)-methyltransferase TrmO [Psychrobacter sp. TAE2020]|uniref:tRNA (N6-threonylcarbamoyladenosine(37)-N6)-methyltransferase TrmO n=1 Tax=Psychrobacter sp. TAE2020 TaxID=2846762 RepID=UPI001C0FE0E6|nr:tRNA (N6-threonylcarbamoyladenosine(37)-N6)-methyltransferase TrmO [Psychrobacter sp. TAE2020]MBU5616276.1 tRNA (N6-threonylcarbamoyladenosine(37)-N6)-methyltransferase TrmO [Psychrobacter sp. TAE2020]